MWVRPGVRGRGAGSAHDLQQYEKIYGEFQVYTYVVEVVCFATLIFSRA